MAGLETAAGAIGIAQFGFSLATTLTTYIGDFRDVSGDITGLANEITATYRQVGELESLLTKNKSTQSLSDNVRLEAEDCQVKAGKLSARLWKQLGKSHAEVPKGRLLGSDDVNVSVFSRARWPIYKPRLEQLKSELMVLKQNIMMVFAMAQMNNESSAVDRLRTQEQINKLQKGKDLALQSLKEATRKRKLAKKQQPHRQRSVSGNQYPSSRSQPKDACSGKEPKFHVRSSYVPERGPSYDSYLNNADEDDLSISGSTVEQATELIYKGVLAQIQQEEQEKKLLEEKSKRREEELITEFKDRLVKDLHESEEKVELMRRRLRESFGESVTQDQVEAFVARAKQEAIEGKDIARLLEKLADLRTTDAGSASHEAEAGTNAHSFLRTNRLRELFRLHRGGSRRTRETSRRDSVSSAVDSYDTSSAASSATVAPEYNYFRMRSVVVSVDGPSRTVIRVQIPGTSLKKIAPMRDEKCVERTLETYARLDLETRRLAEEPQKGESFRSKELRLLYARALDEKRSTARKLLDASFVAVQQWKFRHVSFLLIYVIEDPETTTYYRTVRGPRGGGPHGQLSLESDPMLHPMHEGGTGPSPYSDISGPQNPPPPQGPVGPPPLPSNFPWPGHMPPGPPAPGDVYSAYQSPTSVPYQGGPNPFDPIFSPVSEQTHHDGPIHLNGAERMRPHSRSRSAYQDAWDGHLRGPPATADEMGMRWRSRHGEGVESHVGARDEITEWQERPSNVAAGENTKSSRRISHENTDKKADQRQRSRLRAQRLAEAAFSSRSRSMSRCARQDPNPSTLLAPRRVLPAPPLRQGSSDSAGSFKRAYPQRRPTNEYPRIDTIIESDVYGGGRNDAVRFERRDEIIKLEDRRPPRRARTFDESQPGRSILKASAGDEATHSADLDDERQGENQADDDDEMSDLYVGNVDDSLSDSSFTESAIREVDSDGQAAKRLSEGSMLQPDRTLTDSPASMSSRDSARHFDRPNASTAGRNGAGGLRRVSGSVSSSSARSARSAAGNGGPGEALEPRGQPASVSAGEVEQNNPETFVHSRNIATAGEGSLRSTEGSPLRQTAGAAEASGLELYD